MDKLLSVGQVAKRLRVSVDVVRSLDERGELKGRRTPGGHRRYLPADVDRLIARLRAGRSGAQTRALRSPAPRRPPTSPHERRPPEPDDFDVEEDVPDIEELEAEVEREAANERAAAEAKASAAAADAEHQRLEGLKKYGRDLAFYSLPAEWRAQVIEDLEEFVTPGRVPASLAGWQAQEIVKSRVDVFKKQYYDAEDKRRKQVDDQRKIEWLLAWGKSYAVSVTGGVDWGSSEQDRARREVESDLKQKVKADMSYGHVKDFVDDVLKRWEDDTEDGDEDEDYEDGDGDDEDEQDEGEEEEEDESEW